MSNQHGWEQAQADLLRWTRRGAWRGGSVAALTVAATPRAGVAGLVGGRAGLYAWDGGENLSPTLRGIVDPSIVAVALTGATALAATESGRLYRNDAGLRGDWQEIQGWAGLGAATALAPSPDFDRDGALFIGTATGVFRTLDGGSSWEECNFGLLDTEILCLVCAPDFADSRRLWAGSAGGGLYRSRNAARAWRESGNGLPDAPVQALVLAPDFLESGTIFAGLEDHGVFISQDGGDSWSLYGLASQSVNALVFDGTGRLLAGCNTGLFVLNTTGEACLLAMHDEIVLSLAAAGANIGVGIYGLGIRLSADGAQTWVEPTTALHAPPLVAAATTQDWMALDADGWLAHTQDAGETWHTLPEADLNGVFGVYGGLDVQGRVVYYAATGIGLCRWDGDGGWPLTADTPFHDHTALAVELSPDFATDETLLVVGHDGALLISTDAAATWHETAQPWQGQALLQAHFAPGAGPVRTLLALSAQPTAGGHVGLSVWESHDLGASWDTLATLTSGVPAVLMAWPQDETEQAVFLATQHRIVKIYTPTKSKAPAVHQYFFAEGTRVTALAASPTYADDGVLWAATDRGLFRSEDRGLTWQQAAALPDDLPVVTLLPGTDYVAAVGLGGQVWRLG